MQISDTFSSLNSQNSFGMEKPSHSPSFYWNLANAAYSKNPNKYLTDTHMDDVEFEAKFKAKGDWKFLAFKHKEALIVSFRGSKTWKNWRSNACNLIKDPHHIFREMEVVIRIWTKVSHKTLIFVGHSAGGYFATHVLKFDPRIFRITFNAFKAERGPKNWNLRTNEDWVSSNRFFGGIQDRYFTIGQGRHAMETFAPHIDTLSWEDILERKFIKSSNENILATLSLPLLENFDFESLKSFKLPSFVPVDDNEALAYFLKLALGITKDEKLLEEQKKLQEELLNFRILQSISHVDVHNVLDLLNSLTGAIDTYLKTNLTPFVQISKNLFSIYENGTELCNIISTFSKLKKESGFDHAVAAMGGFAGILGSVGVPLVGLIGGVCNLYHQISTSSEKKEYEKQVDNTLLYFSNEFKSILKGLQDLAELQLKSTRVIQDHIELVRDDIEVSLVELKSDIINLEERRLKDQKQTNATKFLMKIDERILKIKKECAEKSKELDLSYFNLLIDEIKSPLRNALNQNEKTRASEANQAAQLIDLSLLAYNPSYYTGLIGFTLGFKNLPNFILLKEVASLFLKDLTKFETTCQDKETLTEVKKNILIQCQSLFRLMDDPFSLIKNLMEIKSDLTKVLKLKDFRIQERDRQLIQTNWHQIDKNSLIYGTEFIGQKKTWCSRLFATRIEKLQKYVLRVLQNYNPNKYTTTLFESSLKCSFAFSKMCTGVLLERKLPFNEESRNCFIDTIKQTKYGFSSKPVEEAKLDYVLDKTSKTIRQMVKTRRLLTLTHYAFDDVKKKLAIPDNNLENGLYFFHDRLVIELSAKQSNSILLQKNIFAQTESDGIYYTAFPDGRIVESDNKDEFYSRDSFVYRITIDKKGITPQLSSFSGIQSEDVETIPAISGTDDANYRNLINLYFIFLEHNLYNTPISNPLGEALQSSTIISAIKTTQLIPLALPSEVINFWKKWLKAGHDLEDFILKYDFAFDEKSENYQLSLCFLYNSERYVSVVIAEFDPITVECYTVESEKFNFNEFLIQTLYGPLVDKDIFGIADKLTRKSSHENSPLIAYHESPFPGLYTLLQNNPRSLLKFDSAQYDSKVNFDDALVKLQWLPRAVCQKAKEHRHINQTLRERTKTETKDYDEIKLKYEKTYNLFLAFCSFGSSKSLEALEYLIWEDLGLPPPAVVANCYKKEFSVYIEDFLNNAFYTSRSENYHTLMDLIIDLGGQSSLTEEEVQIAIESDLGKVEKYFEKKDFDIVANLYHKIGATYVDLNNFSEASKFFELALGYYGDKAPKTLKKLNRKVRSAFTRIEKEI